MYTNKGFTIVELLIVIVVIAILAAITVVAFQGVNERAQKSAIDSEITQLTKELKLAAVNENVESCNFLATYTNDIQQWYNKTLLTAPVALKRCEPNIMLDTWQSPAPGIVNEDLFAAYWKGVVTIPTTGSYTFIGGCDDGMRLFINNKLVMEYDGVTTNQTYTASLSGNEKILVRFEFGEGAGGARGTLEWTGPGIARTPVIPNA